MKRTDIYFIFLVCIALILCSCQNNENDAAPVQAQVANPIVTYRSIADMNQVLPFPMAEIENPAPYQAYSYAVIDGEMGQITYHDGEEQMVLRITTGTGDISGIYGAEWKNTASIRKIDVEFWQYDDYLYALWCTGDDQNEIAYSLLTDSLSQKELTTYVTDLIDTATS